MILLTVDGQQIQNPIAFSQKTQDRSSSQFNQYIMFTQRTPEGNQYEQPLVLMNPNFLPQPVFPSYFNQQMNIFFPSFYCYNQPQQQYNSFKEINTSNKFKTFSNQTGINQKEQQIKIDSEVQSSYKEQVVEPKAKRLIKLWTKVEDQRLTENFQLFKGKWIEIAKRMPGRNISQCAQRWRRIKQCNSSRNLWTQAEDQLVLRLIKRSGKNWKKISENLPSKSGKQVRERYINHLDPSIVKREWTQEEDELILSLYKKIGKKWSLMSQSFEGRSENMLKNRFYTHIQKVYLGEKNPYYVIHQVDNEDH